MLDWDDDKKNRLIKKKCIKEKNGGNNSRRRAEVIIKTIKIAEQRAWRKTWWVQKSARIEKGRWWKSAKN